MQQLDTNLLNDPLYKKYIALQVAKMEREETERLQAVKQNEQDEERKKTIQLRDAHEEEEKRKRVAKQQSYCPHMQGTLPLVRGQRLGGNQHHIFCQFCLKEWHSWQEVPAHLHSPSEYYGGPIGF